MRVDTKQVEDWLIGEARSESEVRTLLASFCERLTQCGFHVDRGNLALRAIHPEIVGKAFIWTPTRPVESMVFARGEYKLERYLRSPLPVLERHRQTIRRRLTSDTPSDFPVMDDLKAEGFTDYVIFPLVFSTGEVHALSFATHEPDGFTDTELTALEHLTRLLAILLEVHETRRLADTLLGLYLGRSTGERVLRGDVVRGDGETIHAALFHCDLRDFTAMTRTQGSKAVVGVLNAFFDCMATPVHSFGGEVLKFMGDAMLAIFPLDSSDAANACGRALDAAIAARVELARLSSASFAGGTHRSRAGFALHVGEVVYGNVGSRDRLDFTVIGDAVNLLARLQGVCSALDLPIVMSEAFSRAVGAPSDSVGNHVLKGFGRQEVFVPSSGACR